MSVSKKNLLGIHKWLGLVAGLFVLLMGLSGSLLVFDDEIDHYLNRDVIDLSATDGTVNIDAAYRSVQHKYPNWSVRITHIPEEADRSIQAQVRRPHDQRRILYVHPSSGTILRDLDSNETFSYWMLNFHYNLHSGFWGEILLFLAGFCFLGSLITGFWFYRKSIWRVITFKIRPRFRSWQSGSSELHRFVGVWALLMNFLMALTGIILMLIVVGTNTMHLLKGNADPIPNPPPVTISIDNLLNKAQTDMPGFVPSYIEMPETAEDPITIYGHMNTDWPIHYEFSNHIKYGPQTGTETSHFLIRNNHWSYDILSVAYPLHFGDWDGLLIKIIYCLAGLAPPLFSITGFIIWRNRWQKPTRIQQSHDVKTNQLKTNPN